MRNDLNDSYDVIVIGAGMAGLTAGRTLAEAGRRVLLVEARERIGGRILTRHLDDEVIEYGAEFIHGRPPELWALIKEAGLETYEREGSQLCFEGGRLGDCTESHEESFSLLDDLEDMHEPDMSFAEYLDRKAVAPGDRARAIGFVEGFNAADHRLISALSLGFQQRAEDAIEGDRAFALRGGYGQLPAFLAAKFAAAGGILRLNTPVRAVQWQPSEVKVLTDGGTLTAACSVVTLPLGVLQAGVVPFTPPLLNRVAALQGLQMGQVQRFTLVFRERFWEKLGLTSAAELSFLFATDEMPPVWWTPHPAESNTLTGWVGGPRSASLAALSSEALAAHALESLGRIVSVEAATLKRLLLRCESHNWQADPWSLGAYSYVAAGGMEASETLSQPVENTLFFAGEHTDTTGYWGTVHAAMRSGYRVAAQILAREMHR